MSSPIAGLGPINVFTQMPSMGADTSASEGFGGVLKNALQQVNELSTNADTQVSNLLHGGNVDMSSVMVEVEKADVAFQLALQVRNKIVSAYQDIEKMQF